MEDNRGLTQQWGRSKHYGANVGCYECHKAEPGDADAFRHKNYLISVIVSPKDCGRCHDREAEEFGRSIHARSGTLTGTQAEVMGSVVQGKITLEGQAAAMNGCRQCHGGQIGVQSSGKLDPATWPNSGIGRLNPDGSIGACTACHQRHEFSQSQARRPESCGKCHRGPAHPQKEVYDESKHGINFYANVERMNLDSPKWIVGEDYDAAPTCATCHMSATREIPLTHDVGERISWNLRLPVSYKVDELPGNGGREVKGWKERRDDMMTVCVSCHTESIVKNFYWQYDEVVRLYNTKFALPGERIMAMLAESGLRTPQLFDEGIEWSWFKLGQLAGRRARVGASMMAPDHVQWQGLFEVAELFYSSLLPQADALVAAGEKVGRKVEAQRVKNLLQAIREYPEHRFLLGGTKPAGAPAPEAVPGDAGGGGAAPAPGSESGSGGR
ncbi:MAG: hydroxylamine oxidoreductase [Magnetococcales bacterium]|nr:hydroxylamine oxidoreductase [Magnetococcales bacterium]MBF0156408.1 hydroxylamine oxidoreductase [Magnetococcales bacterium]